jgi:hypothetical protein
MMEFAPNCKITKERENGVDHVGFVAEREFVKNTLNPGLWHSLKRIRNCGLPGFDAFCPKGCDFVV